MSFYRHRHSSGGSCRALRVPERGGSSLVDGRGFFSANALYGHPLDAPIAGGVLIPARSHAPARDFFACSFERSADCFPESAGSRSAWISFPPVTDGATSFSMPWPSCGTRGCRTLPGRGLDGEVRSACRNLCVGRFAPWRIPLDWPLSGCSKWGE